MALALIGKAIREDPGGTIQMDSTFVFSGIKA